MNSEISKKLAALKEDPQVRALSAILGVESELHLVGGSVRDALISAPEEEFFIQKKDLDFACKLAPEEMKKILSTAGARIIPSNLAHNTVACILAGGNSPIEITSFRGACTPEAGVLSNSINEDLSYRDITVNALAIDIHNSFTLIDLVGGLADIQSKIIRAVGKASERFSEDPLRILRMVRFASQLRFEVEAETLTAARNSTHLLSSIAKERIRSEFEKILLCPTKPSRGIELLEEIGALELIAPELSAMSGFEQNRFHQYELLEHSLHVLDGTSPNLELRLAALFHDVGKVTTLTVDDDGERHFYLHEKVGAEMSESRFTEMGFSKKMISGASELVALHMRPLISGDASKRRLLRALGDRLTLWRELKYADASACKFDPKELAAQLTEFDAAIERILAEENAFTRKDLAISGSDLIAEGYTPSRRFADVLEALLEEVIEKPELNSREYLLPRARTLFKDLAISTKQKNL